MDHDLDNMTHTQLVQEVMKLRTEIRRHRDASQHELCWFWPSLWNLLPEKVIPNPTVPPKEEFLRCCREYRDSLDGLEVTSEVDKTKTTVVDILKKNVEAAERADGLENAYRCLDEGIREVYDYLLGKSKISNQTIYLGPPRIG